MEQHWDSEPGIAKRRGHPKWGFHCWPAHQPLTSLHHRRDSQVAVRISLSALILASQLVCVWCETQRMGPCKLSLNTGVSWAFMHSRARCCRGPRLQCRLPTPNQASSHLHLLIAAEGVKDKLGTPRPRAACKQPESLLFQGLRVGPHWDRIFLGGCSNVRSTWFTRLLP